MKERFFKKSKAIKIFLICIGVPVMIALFTWVVMLLWNAILPEVTTVIKPINFWQSLGILVLSKILFSGFGGERRRGRGRKWKAKMTEKWDKMSDEERQQFRQSLRDRCEGWGRRWSTPREQTQTGQPGAE